MYHVWEVEKIIAYLHLSNATIDVGCKWSLICQTRYMYMLWLLSSAMFIFRSAYPKCASEFVCDVTSFWNMEMSADQGNHVFFYRILRYGCWWRILDRASVLCQLKIRSFASVTGKTVVGGIVQNSYFCWAGDLFQDDAQVCSSMKRWRWRNSEASHIAEKVILCFQKCSWSILYVTGKQPIDYNL